MKLEIYIVDGQPRHGHALDPLSHDASPSLAQRAWRKSGVTEAGNKKLTPRRSPYIFKHWLRVLLRSHEVLQTACRYERIDECTLVEVSIDRQPSSSLRVASATYRGPEETEHNIWSRNSLCSEYLRRCASNFWQRVGFFTRHQAQISS